jgi:hypothetical protein
MVSLHAWSAGLLNSGWEDCHLVADWVRTFFEESYGNPESCNADMAWITFQMTWSKYFAGREARASAGLDASA